MSSRWMMVHDFDFRFGCPRPQLETADGGGSPVDARGVEVIAAPSDLGLRPPRPGREPGAWTPAGSCRRVSREASTGALVELPRPPYDFESNPDPDPNGLTIRDHAFALADAVEDALSDSRSPSCWAGTAVTCSAARRGRDGEAAAGCCTSTAL